MAGAFAALKRVLYCILGGLVALLDGFEVKGRAEA